MNPMTNVKNITKLNEKELVLGVSGKTSWHMQYKDSAWIFVGGLPYDLTEGDIICVFSQYGEIVNINLVRDKKSGKSKGYCFICYEDQKSTILAVDNFNGIKILGRTIRVDHVADYKPPKDKEGDDVVTKQLHTEGCAPQVMLAFQSAKNEEDVEEKKQGDKKHKKKKKKKSKHKSSSKHKDGGSSDSSDAKHKEKITVKQEKDDPGYIKYENPDQSIQTNKHSSKGRLETIKEPSDKMCGNSKHSRSNEKSSRKQANEDLQQTEGGKYKILEKDKNRSLHKTGDCNREKKTAASPDVKRKQISNEESDESSLSAPDVREKPKRARSSHDDDSSSSTFESSDADSTSKVKRDKLKDNKYEPRTSIKQVESERRERMPERTDRDRNQTPIAYRRNRRDSEEDRRYNRNNRDETERRHWDNKRTRRDDYRTGPRRRSRSRSRERRWDRR